MIINHNVQAIAGAYGLQSTPQARRAQEPAKAQAGAEVVFSDEAQSFSAMLQELKGMDETRTEKIGALRGEIEAGTYSPSARDVAASLLALRY